MEKRKSLSIIILSMTFLLIVMQASISCSAISQNVNNEVKFETHESKDSFNHISFSTNALNFTTGETIEPIWFVINIVIMVLTPIGFILPGILINKRKKTAEKEISDDISNEDIKLESLEPEQTKTGKLLIRLGFLIFFIQNIAILLMYIIFFVLIPVYSDPQAPINVIRIYLILFELDFLGALLILIGLVILAVKNAKHKILGFFAAGSWLTFIGVAIYPRIEMIIGLTGNITTTEGALSYGEELLEYITTFYGTDVMLQTLGFCFLAISIVLTSLYLIKNIDFKGKGILNTFGIMNYTVGSLMNVLLLSILTFADTMTEQVLGMIGILYLIILTIKLIAIPIVGLIAGIMTFNKLKPEKAVVT